MITYSDDEVKNDDLFKKILENIEKFLAKKNKIEKRVFRDKNDSILSYIFIMKSLVSSKTFVELRNILGDKLQDEEKIKGCLFILIGLNLIKKIDGRYLLLIPDTFIEEERSQGNPEDALIILSEIHSEVKKINENDMFSYHSGIKYKKPKSQLFYLQKMIKSNFIKSFEK